MKKNKQENKIQSCEVTVKKSKIMKIVMFILIFVFIIVILRVLEI